MDDSYFDTMSGIDKKNVPHQFDLTDMVPGDSFFGCDYCWHQRPKNHISYPVCPHCGRNMYQFLVTQDDVKNKMTYA